MTKELSDKDAQKMTQEFAKEWFKKGFEKAIFFFEDELIQKVENVEIQEMLREKIKAFRIKYFE